MFKLRSFLRENSTKENINFVFPSVDDIAIDPDLFMGAVITRGDDFDELTLDFLKQFLRDLYDSKIGELIDGLEFIFIHLLFTNTGRTE